MSEFMQIALDEAMAAQARGEVPVGAVIVRKGIVLSKAGNRTRELNDPTAHPEIMSIREATQAISSERLIDCDLYVALEPCQMCAGAISFARIRRLYFGAQDEKGGAVENGVRFYASPACHHAPEVYSGMAEREASEILTTFFKKKRPEGR